MAYTIKEEDIPSELIVNTDQTQVVYAQGSKLMWAETGAKQVSVVEAEEKHAFTAVVSVSNSREMLPLQAVYDGATDKLYPKSSAPCYNSAGFMFEVSGTSMYWSNHKMMHTLVDEIIAPYFNRKKVELRLPESQKSLWQIDIWSVHRSKEFCRWMRTHYPNIIVHLFQVDVQE